MKKCLVIAACILSMTAVLWAPSLAEDKKFRIEVLQVTNIEPYQKSYSAFIAELARNGFVQGKNLEIRRKIIGFDMEKANLWSRVGVLMQIKGEAMRIADVKPDLVLTIGTPSTKHAKDKVIGAGIPLVFTAVAIPTAAGCKSQTQAGPGFTGSTLYMSMKDALKIVKLAFPKLKTIGIVHSDDENGIAHVEEAKKVAPTLGMTVISKEIDKNSKLTPVLGELQKQGVEAFAVPLDTYYGLRNYEACHELEKFSMQTKIPAFSFALMKVPGALLYVGSDFGEIGTLSGQQAAKILKGEAKPEALPILKQEDLRILVDTKMMKALNWQLPMDLLRLAKSVE
ncbi:MAG: ABC transporter substrate-binding protein [Desulfobacterota bacterium]|nr:ABC transporter substrate-binding protein [Thermodesulfobacteriota bacterium]